ncbi:sigma-70 family RNA polymerase sigma factor [Amedibacillus sp. YH-ame10]
MHYENDYELIYLIHSNDEIALRLLLEKYEGFAKATIKRYKKNMDRKICYDDLMQLARIKLLQAVDNYRVDCDVAFFCYYADVFRNAMIDDYRERFTYKSACERFTLSLDMQVRDIYEQYTYLDIMESQTTEIPATVCDRILKAKRKLSPMEKRIFDLRMQGYTYVQISQQLQINTKKVDNTLRKIRKQKRK